LLSEAQTAASLPLQHIIDAAALLDGADVHFASARRRSEFRIRMVRRETRARPRMEWSAVPLP